MTFELLEARHLLSADLGHALLASPAVDRDAYDPSKLIVRLRPDAAVEELWSLLPGTSFKATGDVLPGLYAAYLHGDSDVATAVKLFASSASVLYAEPDYRIELEGVVPNDPLFGSLWGLHNSGQSGGLVDADVDAPEAWSLGVGSAATVVAVIDTGVDYRHPDLAGNMWVNSGEVPGNGRDDDGNGYVDDVHGYDFANDDGDPLDDEGHGTHVAGTIGAVGNNGIGVAGVNWDVSIMALKFLDAEGSGFTSDAIRALDYAIANGAVVSNASWGGGDYSRSLADALARARNADHVFVAAAGNDETNTDVQPHYPSSYGLDNIISVAATDRRDELAWFSNFGATSVDLGAPGVGILSTTPGNTYSSYSGTSMATPHVAGAVALLRGLHPQWTYAQVVDHLLATVDPLPALTGLTASGGRLNLATALETAGPDSSGPHVTHSDPSGSVSGALASVQLTFNEAIDPATFTVDDVADFHGPHGPIDVVSVTATTDSRQFEIAFAPQTAFGRYTLLVGPQLSDVHGNRMDQDRDGVGGEVPDDVYPIAFTINERIVLASADVPQPIRDWETTRSLLTVEESWTIADVNVQLDITHTWNSDLRIFLDSPSGTRVVLSSFRGDNGDDFAGTIFDDEAALPIASGAPPWAGSFRPDQPLAAYDGEDARGAWLLSIEDWYLEDEGSLNGWSLILEAPPRANQPPVLAAIGDRTVSHAQGRLAIPLDASDADGDALAFSATAENLAYQVDQQLQLYSTGNLSQNWGGRGERWLRSANDEKWYFILPSGDLYRWDGSGRATGTLIETLGPYYYENIQQLYDAQALAPAVVQIETNEDQTALVVDPLAGFEGLLAVRVTVSDGSAEDTQTARIAVLAPAAALAPTGDGPLAVVSAAAPTLTWTAVYFAASYDLWVRRVDENGQTIQDQIIRETNLPETSYTPAAALPRGHYQFWVAAINSAGERSAWSTRYDFRLVDDVAVPGRPTVSGPAAIVSDATPTFSWTADENASRYELHVRRVDENGQTIQDRIIREAYLRGPSFTATAPLPQGRYQVWVAAVNSEGEKGPWSRRYDFQLVDDVAVPARPTVTSPAAVIADATPRFAWTADENASRYDLYVRLVDAGGQTIQDQIIRQRSLGQPSFTPSTPLPAGHFQVWVRAENSEGESSGWSDRYDFRIGEDAQPAPLAPTVTGPASPTLDTTPTITWTAVTFAARYDLWVRRVDENGQTVEDQIIRERRLTQASYTPATALPLGRYQAWVMAVNSEGEVSDWSDRYDFSIEADAQTAQHVIRLLLRPA